MYISAGDQVWEQVSLYGLINQHEQHQNMLSRKHRVRCETQYKDPLRVSISSPDVLSLFCFSLHSALFKRPPPWSSAFPVRASAKTSRRTTSLRSPSLPPTARQRLSLLHPNQRRPNLLLRIRKHRPRPPPRSPLSSTRCTVTSQPVSVPAQHARLELVLTTPTTVAEAVKGGVEKAGGKVTIYQYVRRRSHVLWRTSFSSPTLTPQDQRDSLTRSPG
jgi:hypothetical protein